MAKKPVKARTAAARIAALERENLALVERIDARMPRPQTGRGRPGEDAVERHTRKN